MEVECRHCGKTDPDVQLRLCRVCHKHYCDDHAVERSGVSFCSSGCSIYFFHADHEDEDGDGEY